MARFPALENSPCPNSLEWRLPNGNTVIASYGARADEGVIKVFELNRDKQIVWQYTGPHRAHEVQVLSTNGQPISGPAQR